MIRATLSDENSIPVPADLIEQTGSNSFLRRRLQDVNRSVFTSAGQSEQVAADGQTTVLIAGTIGS